MKKQIFKSFSFPVLVRLVAVPTFAAGVALFSLLENGKTNEPVVPQKNVETVEVKLLPEADERLSAEERFWQFQKFLDPATEIPDPIPAGLPNYCGTLFVRIDEKGQITLNSEANGSVENVDVLKQRLAEVFKSRAEAGGIGRTAAKSSAT